MVRSQKKKTLLHTLEVNEDYFLSLLGCYRGMMVMAL